MKISIMDYLFNAILNNLVGDVRKFIRRARASEKLHRIFLKSFNAEVQGINASKAEYVQMELLKRFEVEPDFFISV